MSDSLLDSSNLVYQIILIGIGATIVMDLWAILLKQMFHIPPLNWAFVGRWIGHFPKGKVVHNNIAKSAPVTGELAIGWLAHYMIGISFSISLVAIVGFWLGIQSNAISSYYFRNSFSDLSIFYYAARFRGRVCCVKNT